MKKYHRYQLISPITGQKIYQATSIKKASDKCYKELKDSGFVVNNKDKQFIILNIDTNEPYIFKVKDKNIDFGKSLNQQIQNGGNGEEIKPEDLIKINANIADKITKIETNIQDMNTKINNLQTDIIELKNSNNPRREQIISVDALPTNEPKNISGEPQLPENHDNSFRDDQLRPSDTNLTSNNVMNKNREKLNIIKNMENKKNLKTGCILM
jgi:hypothetical protein